MFGYVSVNKAHLTEEEYGAFSSYYCGVCKATGDVASQLARLGLSYDITFLALLLGSVFDEGEEKEINIFLGTAMTEAEIQKSVANCRESGR